MTKSIDAYWFMIQDFVLYSIVRIIFFDAKGSTKYIDRVCVGSRKY